MMRWFLPRASRSSPVFGTARAGCDAPDRVPGRRRHDEPVQRCGDASGSGDEHDQGLYLHFTHVSKQNSRSRCSPEPARLVPCPAAPREEDGPEQGDRRAGLGVGFCPGHPRGDGLLRFLGPGRSAAPWGGLRGAEAPPDPPSPPLRCEATRERIRAPEITRRPSRVCLRAHPCRVSGCREGSLLRSGARRGLVSRPGPPAGAAVGCGCQFRTKPAPRQTDGRPGRRGCPGGSST